MRSGIFVPAFLVVMLAGCGNTETAIPAGKPQGRYAGIGTFDVGPLWAHLKGVPAPSDASAARIDDDDQIIVIIDSHTGEVRQCGNHSGHCVAMNPWNGQAEPVQLELHASELEAEEGAVRD